MATSNLISPLSKINPLNLSTKPHNSSTFFFTQKTPPLLTLTKINHKSTNPRRVFTIQCKESNSVDAPDRLISAICYFYPFFDGVQYGKYVITQFSPIQTLLQPLIPAIKRSFNPKDGVGLDLLMSLDSTVFLFLLVCLVYGSSSCILGQLPRLPIVAEAAERQLSCTKTKLRIQGLHDHVPLKFSCSLPHGSAVLKSYYTHFHFIA
ncbi:hypothetical protein F8388_008175 [Cannabis sativa]|uniref:Protein TIC 20 n=1 Tax=Cannabis sativa TaxID=3483 RepID=A0A7J6EV49_CANSA|nr:hypothetical protein F8388_008175 [Cannabis sativa]